MRKIVLVFLIIIAVVLGLLARDLYNYNSAAEALKKIKVEYEEDGTTINERDKISINLKISGVPQTGETKIIIHADNRYLELAPESFKQAEGVSFEGMKGGYEESVFSVSHDAEIRLTYWKKGNNSAPLTSVYSSFVTEVDNYILSDTILFSDMYPFSH